MLKLNGLQLMDALCLEEFVDVTVSATTTHNWNPAGLSTATIIRANPTTGAQITGVAGGANGRILQIHNVNATNPIRFYAEDTGSTAANRLKNSISLQPQQSATLYYDSTDSRWRICSASMLDNIANNKVGATTNTSTTSTSFVLVDSMTYTPDAGTYLVLFSASGAGDTKDQLCRYSIFKDTTEEPETERHSHNISGHTHVMDLGMNTQTVVTVNGSESINVKYKTDVGVFTVYERCLILTRVG